MKAKGSIRRLLLEALLLSGIFTASPLLAISQTIAPTAPIETMSTEEMDNLWIAANQIVRKNGNMPLNIGPRAAGTIPQEAQNTLLGMGAWLKVNGEAIYGTQPWKSFGEGPTKVAAGAFHDADLKPFTAEDFRFTSKDHVLYAIEMGWPSGREAVIHSLQNGPAIKAVTLLGSSQPIHGEQQPDGLHLLLPSNHAEQYAYSWKLELQ